MKLKILFVVKRNGVYGDYGDHHKGKAGLWNSATFIKNALHNYLHIHSEVVTVIDGNGIDKEVYHYKPTHVILEAVWTTPSKVLELSKLYPNITWIVRVHSKTPFLAMEGVAIGWIKEIANLASNVFVSFNAKETFEEFNSIGVNCLYLPNIYYPKHEEPKKEFIDDEFKKLYETHRKRHVINLGCFGAIRPMKNHVEQAIAGIRYANSQNKVLFFHINSYRLEQRGEEILKNLEALFKGTKHILVKWPWFSHAEFVYLIKKMDISLQVSLSESFNIVTADAVWNGTPVVVSKDIDWIPSIFRADPTDEKDIISKIKTAKLLGRFGVFLNKVYLEQYNVKSLTVWGDYLGV